MLIWTWGFSDRVRGAGQLRVAYFGETDESGIEWVDAPPEEKESESEQEGSGDADDAADDQEGEEDIFDSNTEPTVLDIELSDQGESPVSERSRQAPEMGRVPSHPIDIAKLKRTPFPHQEEAIRWLLELARAESVERRWPGGLLADDMGAWKNLFRPRFPS